MRIEEKLSRAARVAGCCELRDVRTFAINANLESPPASGDRLSYSLNTEISNQVFGEDGESMVVTGIYSLGVYTVTDSDEADDAGEDSDNVDGEPLCEVNFTLAALYTLDPAEDVELEDEELDAFAQTTGQMSLYPYAREFLADITRRMGLPALHIGTLQLKLENRNGE